MFTTRLISTLAALVAALAAALPAAAEPGRALPGQLVEGGGGGVCYSKELLRSKGTWPYVRRLYVYTVWCGSGGLITYRSSGVRTSHDTICWNTSGPYLAKTAGGAGQTFVEVQAWTAVACHSPIYFVSFHDSMMLRIRYFPNGVYQTVASD